MINITTFASVEGDCIFVRQWDDHKMWTPYWTMNDEYIYHTEVVICEKILKIDDKSDLVEYLLDDRKCIRVLAKIQLEELERMGRIS